MTKIQAPNRRLFIDRGISRSLVFSCKKVSNAEIKNAGMARSAIFKFAVNEIAPKVKLKGWVEHMLIRDGVNGGCWYRLIVCTDEEKSKKIKVTGRDFKNVKEGLFYELKGVYSDHEKYGNIFHADEVNPIIPKYKNEIVRFLDLHSVEYGYQDIEDIVSSWLEYVWVSQFKNKQSCDSPIDFLIEKSLFYERGIGVDGWLELMSFQIAAVKNSLFEKESMRVK